MMSYLAIVICYYMVCVVSGFQSSFGLSNHRYLQNSKLLLLPISNSYHSYSSHSTHHLHYYEDHYHYQSQGHISGDGRNIHNSLKMVEEGEAIAETSTGFDATAWLNPNTRGGVIVWSILLITVPIVIYNYFTSTGLAEVQVGAYVGAAFVLISNLLWASTYIFRVANKDMTYAKQLREYENAVLKKRLEELGDDEINALMEEIDRDDDKTVPKQINSTPISTAASQSNMSNT